VNCGRIAKAELSISNVQALQYIYHMPMSKGWLFPGMNEAPATQGRNAYDAAEIHTFRKGSINTPPPAL
jgi:hypothetical protein